MPESTAQNALGPLNHATLLCRRASELGEVYQRFMGFVVQRDETLSAQSAALLGTPELSGNPCLWLGPAGGSAWLRIVENPLLGEPEIPLKHRGWMSLEISVQNLDALAEQLCNSPFRVLGEPAPLAVSDAIYAMQVAGPCGEVLYLTEIREDVPPFELPRAQHPVDSLFIAVLACTEREVSSAFYHRLGGAEALRFDTSIGVLNRAWDKPADHQYPVATVQLHGNTLLEIDHLPEAGPVPSSGSRSGIAGIGMAVASLSALECDWAVPPSAVSDYPWNGRRGASVLGADGERVELIEMG